MEEEYLQKALSYPITWVQFFMPPLTARETDEIKRLNSDKTKLHGVLLLAIGDRVKFRQLLAGVLL